MLKTILSPAPNADDLKDILLKVKAESEDLGLILNVSKTKIMITGGDGNMGSSLVDGTEIEQVTQFNFLGSLITKAVDGNKNPPGFSTYLSRSHLWM